MSVIFHEETASCVCTFIKFIWTEETDSNKVHSINVICSRLQRLKRDMTKDNHELSRISDDWWDI